MSRNTLKYFFDRYKKENAGSTDIERAYHTGAWVVICVLGHAKEENLNVEEQRELIETLVKNANNRGIRPGIGGYSSFIHYDESPWRQGKPGRAGVWGTVTLNGWI